VVEVMGRKAGFIAIFSALAGGAEDILIPETTTDIKKLCDKLEQGKLKGKKSSIVVVAEGETVGNVVTIAKEIKKNTDWDVRVSILGHMQRGGIPTAMERINASRLGVAAVEALLDGKKGVMVGIVNDIISFTSLTDAVTKVKPLNSHYLKVAEILASV
jgi:6-phosphofructokinase 1